MATKTTSPLTMCSGPYAPDCPCDRFPQARCPRTLCPSSLMFPCDSFAHILLVPVPHVLCLIHSPGAGSNDSIISTLNCKVCSKGPCGPCLWGVACQNSIQRKVYQITQYRGASFFLLPPCTVHWVQPPYITRVPNKAFLSLCLIQHLHPLAFCPWLLVSEPLYFLSKGSKGFPASKPPGNETHNSFNSAPMSLGPLDLFLAYLPLVLPTISPQAP